MAWIDELVPASWRGVPFAVEGASNRPGRRLAVHTYPFRDQVWGEDVGLAARVYRIRGFLVDGDPSAGFAPIFAQRDAMQAACNQPGLGTLVHPSLGELQVKLLAPAEFSERKDRGGAVELTFEFIESVAGPVYPASAQASGAATSNAAAAVGSASASDFGTSIGPSILTGAAAIGAAVSTVAAFAVPVLAAMQSVARIIGAVTGLAGVTGRYAGGTRSTLQPASQTVASLLAASTAARTAVSAAIAAATEAAQGLGGATASVAAQNAGTLAAAIQAVTSAVQTGCADPGTAIDVLTPLAQFQAPAIPFVGTDAIGVAMTTTAAAVASACRQAAIMSIALAETAYQPTSYQDAIALRTRIVALIDAEMLVASYATTLALRALRASVVADLTADALSLPEVITVTEPAPRPALAIAYALYNDPSRYNDLVARVDPINPNAMPLSFEALSS